MLRKRKGNICWNCRNWDKCFKYRYGNIKQDYMRQTYREKDSYGDLVIYVEKCDKYKYENPEIPKKIIPLYIIDDFFKKQEKT